LEDILNEIQFDFHENINKGIILRSESNNLENETILDINNLRKTISSELMNFHNELFKITQHEKSELTLMKQEISCLLNDKIKIKLELNSIDTRLSQLENDIGKDLYL
jgi:hypothetical protein